jgi:hypothetical protein
MPPPVGAAPNNNQETAEDHGLAPRRTGPEVQRPSARPAERLSRPKRQAERKSQSGLKSSTALSLSLMLLGIDGRSVLIAGVARHLRGRPGRTALSHSIRPMEYNLKAIRRRFTMA